MAEPIEHSSYGVNQLNLSLRLGREIEYGIGLSQATKRYREKSPTISGRHAPGAFRDIENN
jgi:hypothetical protein